MTGRAYVYHGGSKHKHTATRRENASTTRWREDAESSRDAQSSTHRCLESGIVFELIVAVTLLYMWWLITSWRCA